MSKSCCSNDAKNEEPDVKQFESKVAAVCCISARLAAQLDRQGVYTAYMYIQFIATVSRGLFWQTICYEITC